MTVLCFPDEHARATRDSIPLFKGWFSRTRRSEWAADVAVALFVPVLEVVVTVEDYRNTESELLRLAACLTAHRAEMGEYPVTLNALLPNVLANLPVDIYRDRPFVYRRTKSGYLLYSLGPNGIDDGGNNEIHGKLKGRNVRDFDQPQREIMQSKIPAGSDDISIRVPLPAFKLPQPTTPE